MRTRVSVLWKFTRQAGELPTAYSRKIYLTSASGGGKRVDWQRAESHFWSCDLTSDPSSCLLSLNRSALPIQTKVTDQSTAPLSCCPTPQGKTDPTYRTSPSDIQCTQAQTHIHNTIQTYWLLDQMLPDLNKICSNFLTNQADYQKLLGHSEKLVVCFACVYVPEVYTLKKDAAIKRQHRKKCVKNPSKSATKATGFPVLIAYAWSQRLMLRSL